MVYYLSESKKNKTDTSVLGEKRKSKKERRKEKKAANEERSVPSGAKDEEAGKFIHEESKILADTLSNSITNPKTGSGRSRR